MNGYNVSSVQTTSQLSLGFFSKENMDALQKQIRFSIYDKSKGSHIIGNQDENQLGIIMRSIFLQHALHQPRDILVQILNLNKMVVKFSVNQIWVEIQQHIGYLTRVRDGMVPLDREVNLSKESQVLVNNKIGFSDDEIPIGSLL
jgi:hypothetical protein